MDVRIRKVSILKGKLHEAAINIGAKEDDLVIVKSFYTPLGAEHEIELIKGDPVSYLMRKMSE